MSIGSQWVEAHTRCPPGKCVHKKPKRKYKKRKRRGQVSYL